MKILMETIIRLQEEGFPDILEWPNEDIAEDLISFEEHFETWTPGALIPMIQFLKENEYESC